jgi:hypothetical protein
MSTHLALFEYAERRGLVDDPFSDRPVHLVEIASNGKYTILENTIKSIPRPVDRGSGIKPNLTAESFDILFRMPKTNKQRAIDRVHAAQRAFCESNAHLLDLHKRPDLAKILRSFTNRFVPSGNEENVLHVANLVAKKSGGRETTRVALVVEGTVLSELKEIRKWWKKSWDSLISDVPPIAGSVSGSQEDWHSLIEPNEPVESWFDLLSRTTPGIATSDCMITGRPCIHARIHPKVEGMPGSDGKAPLSSWNEDNYKYVYLNGQGGQVHRDQGDNFTICNKASFGYALALTDILSKVGRKDRTKGSFKTTENAVVAIWTPDPDLDLACSAIINICAPYSTKECVQGAWDFLEKEIGTEREDTIYILPLRGSQGRISTMGLEQVPYKDIISNIFKFREACLSKEMPGIGRLVHILGTSKDSVNLPVSVYTDLVRGTLVGIRFNAKVTGYVTRRTIQVKHDNYTDPSGHTKNRAVTLLPFRKKLLDGSVTLNGERT